MNMKQYDFPKHLFSLVTMGGLLLHPDIANADYITDYSGFWTQGVMEGNLSGLSSDLKPVRLWLEGQARFDNQNPASNMNWYQGMARTALGYAISDRATFWVGYTYLPTQNYGKSYQGEQDVWPAFRYVFPSSIGTFTFREMVESRFVSGTAPGIRPRTMLKLLHPFEFEPRFGFVAWDEVFFNLNNNVGCNCSGLSGFNQNRAFVGVSWTFNESARMEFGYMDQIVNHSTPGTSLYNNYNIVSASIFYGW